MNSLEFFSACFRRVCLPTIFAFTPVFRVCPRLCSRLYRTTPRPSFLSSVYGHYDAKLSLHAFTYRNHPLAYLFLSPDIFCSRPRDCGAVLSRAANHGQIHDVSVCHTRRNRNYSI